MAFFDDDDDNEPEFPEFNDETSFQLMQPTPVPKEKRNKQTTRQVAEQLGLVSVENNIKAIPHKDHFDLQTSTEDKLPSEIFDQGQKKKPKNRKKLKLFSTEEFPSTTTETQNSSQNLSWSALLEQQCPYLRRLISRQRGGPVDPERLATLMKALNLKPCTAKDAAQGECLQRNCAVLWQYYVRRKRSKNKHWKRCGKSAVDPKHYDSECAEARNIADHLFSERGNYSFRPQDLAFMYDLSKVENADPSRFGNLQRISKKRGDAVLKIEYKVRPRIASSYRIVRFLLTENTRLIDYFIKLYDVNVGTNTEQPYRGKSPPTNMYVLMESMDGSMVHFQKHYQKRDPVYWNRLQRMLIHSLQGLELLHQMGYSHNDVKKENLLYKINVERNLVAVKWGDYDCVAKSRDRPHCITARAKDPLNNGNQNGDLFAFGIMVFELLFSEHPAGKEGTVDQWWASLYTETEGQKAGWLHRRIEELKADNPLQPLSTVAYHFIVNENWSQDKRWGMHQALKFLSTHQVRKDRLVPLPHLDDKQLFSLPKPYVDW